LPEQGGLKRAAELRKRQHGGSGSWLNDTVVIPCRRIPWRSPVLRESDPQPSLWEVLLPEELKRLPAELARVDAYQARPAPCGC
jgi:hypothetical protein